MPRRPPLPRLRPSDLGLRARGQPGHRQGRRPGLQQVDDLIAAVAQIDERVVVVEIGGQAMVVAASHGDPHLMLARRHGGTGVEDPHEQRSLAAEPAPDRIGRPFAIGERQQRIRGLQADIGIRAFDEHRPRRRERRAGPRRDRHRREDGSPDPYKLIFVLKGNQSSMIPNAKESMKVKNSKKGIKVS